MTHDNMMCSLQGVLFILDKLGGESDFHKVFKILYFADQKHLKKIGRPIFADVYKKMQYGPVPSFLYDALISLRGHDLLNDVVEPLSEPALLFKPYLQIERRHFLKSASKPDPDDFSFYEALCLDEAIQENKDLTFPQLSEKSHDSAWEGTEENGVINLSEIAKAAGTQPDMLAYIEDWAENEKAVI